MIAIGDILNYLDDIHIRYSYVGNKNLKVTGISSLNNPKPESITWIKKINGFDISTLDDKLNRLIVANAPDKLISNKLNFIICDNPKEVFFTIATKFLTNTSLSGVIHNDSCVESKYIGKQVAIGHNCYIGPDVIIGDNVLIDNNVTIIGKVIIGNNTMIHSGVVIGNDGFGYFQDSNRQYKKVPHFGGVEIGDFVEIGSNTSICRGTIDNTIIEQNVKIGSLCQIAHNVHIHENACIVSCSFIGGSALLEKNVYVAPCVCIRNQIHIGENAFVGMGAVVTKDVEPNMVVVGVPAKPRI